MSVTNQLHRRRLRRDRRLGGPDFPHIQDLYQGTKQIDFQARCGSFIDDAISEARDIARQHKAPGVWFYWNWDMRITILKTDTLKAAVARFNAAWERRKREYANSDRSKRQAEYDRRRKARNQAAFDAAFATRPDLSDLDATVEWIARWQPHVWTYTKWSPAATFEELAAAGYAVNAHAIKEEDKDELARKRAALLADRRRMGEFLIGQAMACMEMKLPPHGIYQTMVDRWRNTPAAA